MTAAPRKRAESAGNDFDDRATAVAAAAIARTCSIPIYVDAEHGAIVELGDALALGDDRATVERSDRHGCAVWPIRPDGTERTLELSRRQRSRRTDRDGLRRGRRSGAQARAVHDLLPDVGRRQRRSRRARFEVDWARPRRVVDRRSSTRQRDACRRRQCGRSSLTTRRQHGTQLARAAHTGPDVSLPEVALRRRGRAAVLRRGQARRRRRRLLRGLGHDRARRDAAQQAGRRPPPVDLRDEQRGVRRRAEGAARARACGRATRSGRRSGSASTSPSRGSRPRSPADPGRRADQGRLQVHRRVPDGRRVRGERRVLHADLRGAAARGEPPRVRADRAAALAAGRLARAADRRHLDGLGRRRGLRRARRPRPGRAVPRGARRAPTSVEIAFIVTDEDRLFERSSRELPDHVEPVRLYEAYLRNFEIEAGRGAR